jgi:hypothetical protein
LTAVAEAQERNHSWNEAEERDLAMYCAFVERHTPEVCRYLNERPLGPKWSPVTRVVQALAVGAKVLQAAGGNAKRPLELVGALFADTSPPPEVDDTTQWEQVRTALGAVRKASPELPSWMEILLEEVGARQSGSKGVYAIDAARLKPAVDDVLARWEIDLRTPPIAPLHRQRPQLRSLLQSGVEEALRRLPTALAQEIERIETWCALVRGHIVQDAEPAETIQKLLKAIEALQAQTVAGVAHPEFRKIKSRAESVSAVAIRAGLASENYVSKDMPRAELLWRMGRSPQEARLPVQRFLEEVSDLLGRVEGTLKEGNAVRGDALGSATQGLRSEIDQLMTELERAK